MNGRRIEAKKLCWFNDTKFLARATNRKFTERLRRRRKMWEWERIAVRAFPAGAPAIYFRKIPSKIALNTGKFSRSSYPIDRNHVGCRPQVDRVIF